VVLAVAGAGRPWATVSGGVELPGVGAGRFGTVRLSGNDLAPLAAVALLALVLALGIAFTRGRGRWAVGAALAAAGLVLAVQALVWAGRAGAEASGRLRRGELEGVAPGAARVATSRAGPALVVAGGLLVAAAGLETVRHGPAWPAMGAAFRAPPDRPASVEADGEPPWEGD
jgi:hypothetical protein